MSRASSIIANRSALRWIPYVLTFVAAGLLSCAAMRVVMDRFDFFFSLSAGLLAALGGGFLAWLAFRFWRHSLPLLCATAMGLCSGVAGVGGLVLMMRLLTALAPVGGITSTIR